VSDVEVMEVAPPRSIDRAFGPLALWMAASFALLVLAVIGPKLWATQSAENAAIAIQIVAFGQAILAAVLWPLWTRTAASALGVLLTSPAWLLLAGRIAESPLLPIGQAAWKLALLLAGLAIIRWMTPRSAVGFVWSLIVAAWIGGPVLWMLSRGG
jgi:hypothetical protein